MDDDTSVSPVRTNDDISSSSSFGSFDDEDLSIIADIFADLTVEDLSIDDFDSEPKFRISPSTLGSYFYLGCEKMLLLKGQQDADTYAQTELNRLSDLKDDVQDILASISVEAVNRPTNMREAHLMRGNLFEESLLEHIPNLINCENLLDGLSQLLSASEGSTLYQARFSVPPSFYNDKLQEAGIVFSTFIPDFIEVRRSPLGKRRLFIIDAKSSSGRKMSHHIQVALYALFISYLLREHSRDDIEIDSHGGVWLPNSPIPEIFSLSPVMPIVEDLVFNRLPQILSLDSHQVNWHLNMRCKSCEYLSNCRADAIKEKTLSSIPYLSPANYRLLKKLLRRNHKKTEVEDIEDIAKDRDKFDSRRVRQIVKYSLSRGSSPYFDAIRKMDVQLLNRPTILLPSYTDFSMIVHLCFDPLENAVFGFGIVLFENASQRQVKKEFYDSISPNIKKDPSNTENDRLINKFSQCLFEALLAVSQESPPPALPQKTPVASDDTPLQIPKPPRLCIFVQEESQKSLIQRTLIQAISVDSFNSNENSKAMVCLLNIFEDAKFIALENVKEHNSNPPDVGGLVEQNGKVKAEYGAFPRMVSLEESVRALVVLPVPGYYTFRDIIEWIVGRNSQKMNLFNSEDVMDMDSLYSAWSRFQASQDDVQKILQKHLQACFELTISLRALVEKETRIPITTLLPSAASPFYLTQPLPLRSPFLAKLAFFKQFETLSDCHRMRSSRIASWQDEEDEEEMLNDTGSKIRIQFKGWGDDGTEEEISNGQTLALFTIDSPGRSHLGLQADPYWMKQWLMTEDTEKGKLEAMRFMDVYCISHQYTPSYGSFIFADITKVQTKNDESLLWLRLERSPNISKKLSFRKGRYYTIERRIVDITLQSSLKALKQIDEHGEDKSMFQHLLRYPIEWGSQEFESYDSLKNLITVNHAKFLTMTKSQQVAYDSLLRRRLSIVFGPPGTGKTYFLAMSVLRLRETLLAQPSFDTTKPFNILVTAMTHTAIENIVQRLLKLRRNLFSGEPEVDICIIYMERSSSLFRYSDIDVKKGLIRSCSADKLKSFLSPTRRKSSAGVQKPIPLFRIFAGTVWQIRKASEVLAPVDLLIVDEASQILVADVGIAIECLNKEQGRLLVVGDPLQLAPIIKNKYPMQKKGEASLAGSILGYLLQAARAAVDGQKKKGGLPCTVFLEENWRMNQELTTFSQNVYGARYISMQPNQQLPTIAPETYSSSGIPLKLQKVFDPRKPLVLLTLMDQGLDASSALQAEAKAVTDIVNALVICYGNHNLPTETAVPLALQEDKPARSGPLSIFIITPHHRQRRAIVVQLGQRNISLPFSDRSLEIRIDTVEKMQGQEADMVIACFGILGAATEDDLTPLSISNTNSFNPNQNRELEFLCDLRRWNVALTRAKSKVVVIASAEILRPKPGITTVGMFGTRDTELGLFSGNLKDSEGEIDENTIVRMSLEEEEDMGNNELVEDEEVAILGGWKLLKKFEIQALENGAVYNDW